MIKNYATYLKEVHRMQDRMIPLLFEVGQKRLYALAHLAQNTDH